MQNGLRISDRQSFLQRIAPNHHEVTLKYFTFKGQFSQKWQLSPTLITVCYTDFFQQNSFCTGQRFMKKHLSLRNTMFKQIVSLPTAASLPSASRTPSHCHTHPSNLSREQQQGQVSAALPIWSSEPVPLDLCSVWEQLGNKVLQKAFFSGAQPRHFSLMPYFSGLCTPSDLDLHFACLKMNKRALICATAAAKL